jgi:predicted RecA/RadA family phage recombinase
MKETSKPTTSIFEAFVKAQKEFGPALKTSTNPHFRSRYADLSACVEAVIDALNANGIGLIQITHPCENGVAVETILQHESGDKMSSGVLQVPASKMDAQGYGSALTYARRYSLMSICGIAPEDDDGNRAAASRVNKTTGEIEQKKSKVEVTTYDIRSLSEEQQIAAAEYLKQHSCEFVESTGLWKCPIRLSKLVTCIVS